jgi:hypothetical protein
VRLNFIADNYELARGPQLRLRTDTHFGFFQANILDHAGNKYAVLHPIQGLRCGIDLIVVFAIAKNQFTQVSRRRIMEKGNAISKGRIYVSRPKEKR